MRHRYYGILWLALQPCVQVKADTVTKTDHLSLNGNILSMSEGVITLQASFPSGVRTLMIDLSAVQSIEFNSISYNPIAPPKVMGIGPSKDAGTGGEPEVNGDVVVLRGGAGRKECRLSRIDLARVYCEPGNNQFNRLTVLRILMKPR